MRSVHLTDLDLATRVLLAIDVSHRATSASGIAAAARIADRYRKRLRHCHPVWGDGTLAAAALAWGHPVAPGRCDLAYRRTLGLLLGAIDRQASFDFHTSDLYDSEASVSKDRTDGQHPGKTA